MPREIFGHVTEPPVSLGSRKWYTVPLSLAAHVAAIVPIVLVPLLASDVLPPLRDYDVFVVAPPAPPEPPAPPRPVQPKQPQAPREPRVPLVAADTIGPEREFVPAPPPDLGPGIANGYFPGGHDVVTAEPPPPPPPVAQAPVRPGGQIKTPERIHHVAPAYPTIARMSHVQGVVILEAVIGVDGRVQNVRVLRSQPLLDQAAVDAVSQWIYTPSTLNGVPVPVIMTVTVAFTLNRDNEEHE